MPKAKTPSPRPASRKTVKKKMPRSLEARRQPATTSAPRLGAYGRKHSRPRLSTGHKAVLRGKRRSAPRSTRRESLRPNPYSHEFLLFAMKHVLTSGGLVRKSGSRWSLKQDIAGVNAGEDYTSLEACANGLLSALQSQFSDEGEEEMFG